MAVAAAAALEAGLLAGVVDEDAADGGGGGAEEVGAVLPGGLVGAHQADVGLVDQGGGLQRLPRPFLGELLSGQLAQLVVDQWQQLPRGAGVALLEGGQDARDLVAHGGTGTTTGKGLEPSIAARAPARQRQNGTTTGRVR